MSFRVQNLLQTVGRYKYLLPLFFASFGFIALRFIFSPLRIKVLTSLLTKDEYATLTLISGTVTFITLVSSLGSLEFIVRRLPGRSLEYQWSMFTTIMKWFGVVAVILAIVGVGVFAAWQPAGMRLTTSDLFACAALLIVTVHMNQIVNFLLARSAYAASSFLKLLYMDTWFLPIMAIAALLGGVNINNVLWVWVVWLAGTAAVAWYWFIKRAEVENQRSSTDRLKEVLVFGLPLVPMIFGDYLFLIQDRYVLLAFRTLEDVANYALCINIALFGTVIGASLLDILIIEFLKIKNVWPTASVEELVTHQELRDKFTMMIKYALIIMVPFGMTLGVASTQVILFLSSRIFLDAAPILPWTIPIPFFSLLNAVLGKTLIAVGRGAIVGRVTFIMAFLNIGLNILLAPKLGPYGTALANGITYGLMTIYFGYKLRCWKWISARALLPGRLLLYASITAVGFIVAVHLPGLGSLLILLIGGLWSVAWIFLLGLVKKADLSGFEKKADR